MITLTGWPESWCVPFRISGWIMDYGHKDRHQLFGHWGSWFGLGIVFWGSLTDHKFEATMSCVTSARVKRWPKWYQRKLSCRPKMAKLCHLLYYILQTVWVVGSSRSYGTTSLVPAQCQDRCQERQTLFFSPSITNNLVSPVQPNRFRSGRWALFSSLLVWNPMTKQFLMFVEFAIEKFTLHRVSHGESRKECFCALQEITTRNNLQEIN